MRLRKDLKPVLEEAGRLGYTVSTTKKQHLKFSKRGRSTVYGANTPSDFRNTKNTISQLRRSDRGVL